MSRFNDTVSEIFFRLAAPVGEYYPHISMQLDFGEVEAGWEKATISFFDEEAGLVAKAYFNGPTRYGSKGKTSVTFYIEGEYREYDPFGVYSWQTPRPEANVTIEKKNAAADIFNRVIAPGLDVLGDVLAKAGAEESKRLANEHFYLSLAEQFGSILQEATDTGAWIKAGALRGEISVHTAYAAGGVVAGARATMKLEELPFELAEGILNLVAHYYRK